MTTPLGEIILLHDTERLVALLWADGLARGMAHLERHLPPWNEEIVSTIPDCTDALESYFNGDVSALAEVRVNPPGTALSSAVRQTYHATSFSISRAGQSHIWDVGSFP